MNNPQAGMTPGPQSPYQPPYQQPYPPQMPAQGQIPAIVEEISAPDVRVRGRQGLVVGMIVAGLVVVLLGVVAFIGGLPEFLGLGVMFVPLAALAALAYAGTKNVVAMVFTYIMLGLTGISVIFYSLANLVLGYIVNWDKFNAVLGGGLLSSASLQGVFDPSAGGGLLIGIAFYFVAALVSAAMLFRPVRVLMSKIMPIDPDNFVHKIALSILSLIFLSSVIPLIVLGGKPPLLNLVSGSGSSVAGQSITVQPLDPIYQLIWTIPAVFVAAGWPIVRRLPEALKRLGLVRPTLTQVAFGLGFGLVLALAGMFVIDPGIAWVWQTLGWETTNTSAFDKLLVNLITPLGAVVIGVTAGLGEELAVRGLLQPRIGLIASNLVFTGFHAFQYGVDGLLSVFIVGTILGIVRARSNTTTSAIVHGVYDFTLLMAVVLFGGG